MPFHYKTVNKIFHFDSFVFIFDINFQNLNILIQRSITQLKQNNE